MGNNTSKTDTGPISVHGKEAEENSHPAYSTRQDFETLFLRLCPEPFELCAIRSNLVTPLFAQIQQLLWSYDDSIHQRQKRQSMRMKQIDQKTGQACGLIANHDKTANITQVIIDVQQCKESLQKADTNVQEQKQSIANIQQILLNLKKEDKNPT